MDNYVNMSHSVCASFIPQEKDARDIEIPNIKWEVFELMMRYDEFLQASRLRTFVIYM